MTEHTIKKHLWVSNHHIHPEDAERWNSSEAEDISSCMLIYDTPYGWILYVGDKFSREQNRPAWMADPAAFKEEKWKTDFDKMSRTAWDNDCEYITFDIEGDGIKEWESYAW